LHHVELAVIIGAGSNSGLYNDPMDLNILDLIEIEKELCDLCNDRVSLCECWRCSMCEELFGIGHNGLEDEEEYDYLPVCRQCITALFDQRRARKLKKI
jgi:hypothetical protein